MCFGDFQSSEALAYEAHAHNSPCIVEIPTKKKISLPDLAAEIEMSKRSRSNCEKATTLQQHQAISADATKEVAFMNYSLVLELELRACIKTCDSRTYAHEISFQLIISRCSRCEIAQELLLDPLPQLSQPLGLIHCTDNYLQQVRKDISLWKCRKPDDAVQFVTEAFIIPGELLS
jgi:hypothetical protein